MHVAFLRFLEQCAKSGGYEPKPTCATFNFARDGKRDGVLPAAVYGIAAVLDDVEALQLEAEAAAKGSLRTPLSKIRRVPLGQVEAIPIYWGKDASVGFRLYRHLLDNKPKPGCLGGRFYNSFANLELLVASLPVCDSASFETYIESHYPSMLVNAKKSTVSRYV